MTKNDSRMSDIFAITDFLDQTRWSSPLNYGEINYCGRDLSDDQKLLTHWFCYVSDRRMPYERIWSVGGFVYSEIVKAISTEEDFAILDPRNPSQSYFVLTKDFPNPKNYPIKSTGKKAYLFRSRLLVGNNTPLREAGFYADTYAYFIPRYYPTDYKSILFTFEILREFDYSIPKYIMPVAKRYLADKDLVRRLLFALYLLTYSDIGQPKAGDINFRRFMKVAKKHKDSVLKILEHPRTFEVHFQRFKKRRMFQQKRAWCSLRDYFKSVRFNVSFFRSMEKHGFKQIELLKSQSLRPQFELPGDVWNNSPKFRQCILQEAEDNRKKKKPMPETIRKIYDEYQVDIGYPEQFDITFSLVPRTCNAGKCDICPYGLVNGKATQFDKLCIGDTGMGAEGSPKFCPVVLVTCGYRRDCTYPDCNLKAVHNRYFG